MSHRVEGLTVNAAGLVQGIALVTFPAASTILTAPGSYGLSGSQYGVMFVPQMATAILASLLGAGLLWPGLLRRFSEKLVLVAGLLADLLSMVLLVLSWAVVHRHALAFALLLVATGCLGAGFGLTVPALNTLAAAFRPAAVDRAVLVLNALLGLGTALAPVFVAAFNGLGFWVGLPVLAACLLAGLIVVSLRLPLAPGGGAAGVVPSPGRGLAAGAGPGLEAGAGPGAAGGRRIPAGFGVFAAFALLYGFCETMNGNWSQLDVTSLGVRASTASLALTAFWAVVTAGRVLIAAIARWVPSRDAYHGLPFLLAGAFVLIALLPRDAPGLAVAAFGLAGLGCSALLPLTISFGQGKLAGHQAMVAGGVIACYQAGYGLAAFGVGPLTGAGIRWCSGPARSWRSSWADCRWPWRTASRRPPLSIPGRRLPGRPSPLAPASVSGALTDRAVCDKSHTHPASSVSRLVVEARYSL